MSDLLITTNIDPRNVARGKCLTCLNRSCNEYEVLVGEKRSNCLYCGHSSTEHEDISERCAFPVENCRFGQESPLTLPPDLTNFMSSTIVPARTPAVAPVKPPSLAPVSPVTSGHGEYFPVITLNPTQSIDDFLGSVEKTSRSASSVGSDARIKSDDLMPSVITPDLERVFVKKVEPPCQNSINKMARTIVNKVVESGHVPSQVLFDRTAKKATKVYSPLKVKGDEECVGLAKKLKRRYLTFMRSNSSVSHTEKRKQVATEDTLEQMRNDWESNNRNPATMMWYCHQLRERRMRATVNQSAADHLRLYPALRLPSVLMREFEIISGTPQSTMIENWNRILPKLVQEMTAEHLFDRPDTDDIELLTILVLQNIHRVKLWNKVRKNKDGEEVGTDRKRVVFEMFPANTPINEVWTRDRDPPRLMGMENPESGIPSVFCFVDTEPLFSVNNVFMALCLLIGTFYVFHITWTPQAKFPLCLLASALIGPKTVISKVSNNSKFVSYLRKIGMDI